MFPLHPHDRLRLAEDRARAMRETRPRHSSLRTVAADQLRRLAAWLDPPPARKGRQASQRGLLLRR